MWLIKQLKRNINGGISRKSTWHRRMAKYGINGYENKLSQHLTICGWR